MYLGVTGEGASGLSPRGRGNHAPRLERLRWLRSIPAWAGEPLLPLAPCHCDRSIPAWAGEPLVALHLQSLMTVYPRVGGGTSIEASLTRPYLGLSPRGRGNPIGPFARRGVARSIPAWTGEPGSRASLVVSHRVYPRVGGGTPVTLAARKDVIGLSPRGRGNLIQRSYSINPPGSIPAWAGEPAYGCGWQPTFEVYPRVGGGTESQDGMSLRDWGLSPRGRGNRHRDHVRQRCRRSIPAWAGEPTT